MGETRAAALVVGVILVGGCTSGEPSPHPPVPSAHVAASLPRRWTKHVELASDAAIPAALVDRKVPGEGLVLVRSSASPPDAPPSRSIADCAQYLEAIGEGFQAENNAVLAAESFFRSRCTPLWFLKESAPSRQSFVGDLNLSKNPLGVLPAALHLEMERPSEARLAQIAAGASLRAYSPELVVEREEATSVTFVDEGLRSTVDVVAWGDFDHDGLEDVLLFQVTHSLEGTYRSYRHVIATRKAANAPITVVRELDY